MFQTVVYEYENHNVLLLWPAMACGSNPIGCMHTNPLTSYDVWYDLKTLMRCQVTIYLLYKSKAKDWVA